MSDERAHRASNETERGVESTSPTQASRFLSVAEVAQELGVSIHTIYGMISERRLPFRHHKFGRRVLVDRRELERWVRDQGVIDRGSPSQRRHRR